MFGVWTSTTSICMTIIVFLREYERKEGGFIFPALKSTGWAGLECEK